MRVLALALLLAFLPQLAAAQVMEVSLTDLYAGGPAAPVISSRDFPDPERWYQPKPAEFSWSLPDDITAVAVGLSRTADNEPQTPYRPPITSHAVAKADWQEGVQYLAVQFRNATKWGRYASFKVMIDATPPEPFEVVLTSHQGEQPGVVASFTATDRLSGLAYFDIALNGAVKSRVSQEEARRGYFVPVPESGLHRVTVTAYDQAGNSRAAAATILITAPAAPKLAADPVGYVAAEPASVLVALMALLTLLMFAYMVYERQRYAHGLAELRAETDDVQMEMLKVFSALREEIYDQINAIDRKPRLSKKEKEAIDGLNKALTVSEKLLQKEVKDVKKIIG